MIAEFVSIGGHFNSTTVSNESLPAAELDISPYITIVGTARGAKP